MEFESLSCKNLAQAGAFLSGFAHSENRAWIAEFQKKDGHRKESRILSAVAFYFWR